MVDWGGVVMTRGVAGVLLWRGLTMCGFKDLCWESGELYGSWHMLFSFRTTADLVGMKSKAGKD